MNHFLALLLGFCVDLAVGDPRWLPHPVQGMGWLIGKLEPPLRAVFPKTERGELHAGVCLVLLVVGLTGLATELVLWAVGLVHPALRAVLEVVICWQILAAKSLRTETMKVVHALERGSLEDGRRAVGMVVGRDTDQLTEEEVLAADVETVAENAADGILAPLLWAALLGPVGGMCYKAVNTMDSMLGYVEPPYKNIGLVPAKMDDIANFIPSRLSALLMIAAGFLLGLDGKNGWQIFRRDRFNHASPNSAQTESVCAGLLGVRLAGDAWYHGVLHRKQYIGDGNREITHQDIPLTCRLMYLTALLTLLLCAFAKGIIIL